MERDKRESTSTNAGRAKKERSENSIREDADPSSTETRHLWKPYAWSLTYSPYSYLARPDSNIQHSYLSIISVSSSLKWLKQLNRETVDLKPYQVIKKFWGDKHLKG